MSRTPSEKTQLANAKREIASLRKDLTHWQATAQQYRTRAIQAEQACAEWKTRFDKLLEFRKLAVTETASKENRNG